MYNKQPWKQLTTLYIKQLTTLYIKQLTTLYIKQLTTLYIKQLTILYIKRCVFLKVVWDVAVGRQVNSHWRFQRRSASTFIPTLNMQEPRSSETVATLYRSTSPGIPEDWNIHQLYCKNLISRTVCFNIRSRYSYAILPKIHAQVTK